MFGKYVRCTLDKVQMVDIVFDVDKGDCVKPATRERRETGQRGM